MITTLQVNKEFELFKEKHHSFFDGSYFEALEDNNGFMMVTYLVDVSNEEEFIYSVEPMKASMVKEGNKILFLVRFGNSPLIFEASFDPTLYKDKRAMQIAFDNHMVTFILVERRTNEIKALRYANFPMNLKMALISAWGRALEEEDANFSAEYRDWVLELCMENETTELWDLGVDIGRFGEKGIFE